MKRLLLPFVAPLVLMARHIITCDEFVFAGAIH